MGAPCSELVGESAAILALRQKIARVARARSVAVLVTGPTGSGKELVARALHALATPQSPFEAFHCAGHPSTLFESAIFGHEQGAFTGASARRAGACELAGAGTLLLDEIGDMPLDLQPKLLRMMETRAYRSLGAINDRPLTARLVAATHVDLRRSVEERDFRADLYHRLAGVVLRVPALDERRGDIPQLTEMFAIEAGESGAFDATALELLSRRSYSGNVRQLRAEVHRALLSTDQRPIGRAQLTSMFEEEGLPANGAGVYQRIAEEIMQLGGRARDHVSAINRELTLLASSRAPSARAAARLLGVDHSTMLAKLAKARDVQVGALNKAVEAPTTRGGNSHRRKQAQTH